MNAKPHPEAGAVVEKDDGCSLTDRGLQRDAPFSIRISFNRRTVEAPLAISGGYR